MRGKLIIAAVACVAALPAPAAASTSATCATAVLEDWADGKLDRVHSVRCYQDALNQMPEDMRSYTTAPDDIQRALLARLRTAREHRHSDSAQPQSAAKPAPKAVERRPAKVEPERDAVSVAGLPATTPTGIHLPLVALAVVGALLLTAGSAGVFVRRLRGRAVRS